MQRKGQALTELAIFGSIFLFCVAMLVQYGLEANYQQQVQMEAFRKAQKIAFNRTGPGASTSLILAKDKPFPDPRDQFGFAERYPIMAGGSVTWDNNLSAQYVNKYDETPKKEDLPAVYFEVDKVSDAKLKEIKSKAKADVPSGQNNVFGFYTARFEKRACPPTIKVRLDDSKHTSGKEYREVEVKKDDIKIMRIELEKFEEKEGIQVKTKYELLLYPYFRDGQSGLKRKIIQADVDGDEKLEYIIGVNKDKDKELFYVDYHGGDNPGRSMVEGDIQIDTAYTEIDPKDKRLDKNTGNWRELAPEDRQGILTDFTKTIQHTGSQIVKTEAKGGNITSTTELHAKQIIMHKIRLNNGEVVEIPVEFAPDNHQPYNWK